MGVQVQKFLIRQLGGMNQGTDPTSIGDNEFENLENVYPYMGRLVRRSGVTKLTTSSAWDENINAMFAYTTSVGTWKLLVGGQTKVGYLSAGTIANIASAGDDLTSDTGRMRWAQYKDTAYFAREANGSLFRTDGLTSAVAGISAPLTAPVLAQGVAGDLAAGDYIGVVAFLNSATGAFSNPSDPSNTLSLGASREIDWSGIAVSVNPQVDSRVCYRTLADQSGEYYEVTTLADNFTTTLSEDVLQNDLGDAASFDNGVPPSSIVHMTVWNERLWTTDESFVYFSEFGLPECYSEFSVIAVRPDDGHTINGLLAFGDGLIVGKTNATYIILGTDESDFALQSLSDRFGVASHDSMKVAEGLAFWFGGENFYMSDGNNVKAIGDSQVRTLIDGIDSQYYHLINSAIVDKLGWYVAGIPANESATINTYLVYNYRTDEWTTFSYNAGTPIYLADFFDSAGQAVVYSTTGDGHLYLWNSGNTDDGTAIAVDILTKRYGIDRDDMLKIMRDVALHTNKIAADVTVDIYADGDSKSSVDFNLYSDNPWKGAAISNVGEPGVYLQLRIQTSATPGLELKGFQMKIIDLNRRSRKVA